MTRRDMTADWNAWRREVLLPDGTTVGYVDVGTGPVALFVHGIFLSSYLWRQVIDDLRRDRRCIAVDLVGHGATTAGDGVAFSMTSQAEMIVAVMDALGVDQVDSVGNDTGVGVCQVIAANSPTRLRSLVLTNCDAHDNWPPTALEDFLINPDLTELTRLHDRLASLEVPTAVIWGDADIFFGPEWAT